MQRRIIITMWLLISLAFIPSVLAAEFHATTWSELQSALSSATINGEDDVVKIAQGTYLGHFVFSSTEGHSLTVKGGYSADFSSRTTDPSKTILDGYNDDRVLYLVNSNGGDLTVDGLTIQNGKKIYSGAGILAETVGSSDIRITNNIISGNHSTQQFYMGGGIYAYCHSDSGQAGSIILEGNRIRNNLAIYTGGGAYLKSWGSTGAGAIRVANNIISGNQSLNGGGLFVSNQTSSGAAADIAFINNTITGNRGLTGWPGGVTNCGGGVYTYSQSSAPGDIAFYNNIIWGNSFGGDIYLAYGGSLIGYNNDYSDLSGTWDDSGNNIDQDPLLVSQGHWDDNGTPANAYDDIWAPGDEHLRGDSPCIDAGRDDFPSPPYRDFEGDSREIATNMDMGADEYSGYHSRLPELAVDFGAPMGLWDYDVGAWHKLNGLNPEYLCPYFDRLAVDFGSSWGLWDYHSGSWTRLSSIDPENTGNAIVPWQVGIAVDFGPAWGLWYWNYESSNWQKITSIDPEYLCVYGKHVAVDLGASWGLWDYDGSSWTKLSNWDPDNSGNSMIAFASGIVVDFGGHGIWYSDGKSWLKLNGLDPEYLAAYSHTLVVDFGNGWGLWELNRSTLEWSRLTSWDPDNTGDTMVAYSTGIAVDFGRDGLWYYNGSAWSKLNGLNPEYLTAYSNKLAVDFGSSWGLWSYDGSSWSKLTTLDPDNRGNTMCDVDLF